MANREDIGKFKPKMKRSKGVRAKKAPEVSIQDCDKNEIKDLIAEIDEMLSSKPICVTNITTRVVGVNSKASKTLSDVKVRTNRMSNSDALTNEKKKNETLTSNKLQELLDKKDSSCKTITIPALGQNTATSLPEQLEISHDKKLVVPSLASEIAKKLEDPNFIGQEIEIEVDNKELLKDILSNLNKSNVLGSAKIKVERDGQIVEDIGQNVAMNSAVQTSRTKDVIELIKIPSLNCKTKDNILENGVTEVPHGDSDIEIIEVLAKDPKSKNHRTTKKQKATDVEKTLLFQAVSKELSNYSDSELRKTYFAGDKKNTNCLDTEEKKLFLKFLYDHYFLCEITNPSMYEILCRFAFLGRKETKCYKNFVTDLRLNLSVELEKLFTKPSEKTMMFHIYQILRNKFG